MWPFRRRTAEQDKIVLYEWALASIADLRPIGTASSYSDALEDAQQWARQALGDAYVPNPPPLPVLRNPQLRSLD